MDEFHPATTDAPPAASPPSDSEAPGSEAPDSQATGSQATGADATGDEGPRPLGIGVRPTGHAPLDARLQRLADADRLGVAAHPEVYEDVHRALRETLAGLDRPAPGR